MNDEKVIKVLLIEDNPGDARLIQEMLLEVTYTRFDLKLADRLSVGMEYLVDIRESTNSVVLLDLGLPDSRGLDTLAKVREQAPEIPVLVLTGLGDEGTWTTAITRGAEDYLVKGEFGGGTLIRAIRYAIERKQAEKALQKSEERLSLAVEGTNLGLWDWMVQTGETVFNERWADIIGYTLEELSPISIDTWIKLCHPDDLKKSDELLEKHFAGESEFYECEARMRHKNGEWVWVLDRGKVVSWDDEGKPVRVTGTHLDITERKKAEEKHRLIIETALEGFWICDLNGKFREVNESYCKMIGYTRDELLQMSATDVEYTESYEETIRHIQKTMEQGYGHFKTQHKRKDGNLIDVEVSVNYLPVAEGQMFVFIHDITERQRAEEALRQSEERFRRFFEDEPEYCYMISPEGLIIDINKAALNALGYEESELIGKPLQVIYAPESLPDVKKCFLHWKKSGKIENQEMTIITKKGQKRSVLLSASAIRGEDGNPLYSISVQTDITERKQAEDSLRAQKEFVYQILASIPEAVLVMDRNLQIQLANRAFYNTFKVEGGEIEGRSILDVLTIGGLHEAISHTLATDERQLNMEFTYGESDGQRILVVQIIPLFGKEEGELLLILRDVTTERAMQQQLYHTRTMASIGEMASGIAHEINNPLTAVVGLAQLLAKRDVPENVREDVNIISEEAQRVASIVKRLLTFARQHKPERGYINVNDVIQVTLKLRKYELNTGSISVTTQFDDELPLTTADAGQLQQVFLNILINAEAALKSVNGNGALIIKTERVDDIIRICFEDNGPGITKEDMDKLFNPFFTTKKAGEGTGLGLSICHGIIAEHGGQIYARSELGEGATFVVELPIISQAEQTRLPELAGSEFKKVTGAKILVVDDEAAIRQYLNSLLTDEGYEVHCVDDAGDALGKLRSNEYSLVLLDIKMPGTSGIDIYKRLQKEARSLARRIVFVTGDVMAPDTRDFLSATKIPCLAKPFNTEELKKELGRILNKSK